MTTTADTPRGPALRRSWAAFLVSLALAGLTAGCSSGNHGRHPSGGANPVIQPTPPKQLLEDLPWKHQAVRISECRTLHGGGALALGEAKNPGKKSVKYRITVQFKAGGKPADWATTTLAVPGHSTAPWAAEKKFPTDGQVTCTVQSVS